MIFIEVVSLLFYFSNDVMLKISIIKRLIYLLKNTFIQ